MSISEKMQKINVYGKRKHNSYNEWFSKIKPFFRLQGYIKIKTVSRVFKDYFY